MSAIPSSLLQHLRKQLTESVIANPTIEIATDTVVAKVMELLLSQFKDRSNNKLLLETGISISKCFRVFPSLMKGIVDESETITSILLKYDEYLAANNSVFANIKGHHDHIGTLDWKEATNNEADLAVYSTAAEKMGDRQWVQCGNDWMKDFAIQFFKEGGAKKHYMRVLREKYLSEHGVEWPNDDCIQCNNQLQRNLLSTGCRSSKIRLLDVGSCYNPFGSKSDEDSSSSLLAVTALDLYPAHPSVLQCDFLNLSVGGPDSAPVTVGPTVQSSSSSSGSSSATSLDPSQMTKLLQLPAGSFDVITMSLVLNYLPSPLHREIMIAKARQLLIGPNGPDQPHPHHRGLLLIVEKHSIFGKDHVERPDLYCAGKGALLKNFKQSICNLGFELVKYREMEPVNNRRSHLFAFATVEMPSDELAQQCDALSAALKQSDGSSAHMAMRGDDGQLLPRLWIKQDFDATLYGRDSTGPTEDTASEQKSRKRERDDCSDAK